MNISAIQPNISDELLLRLAQSRSVTDDLFQIVRPERLYERPIPERHRIIFYVGHLEAFDWNLIACQTLGLGAAHKEFDRLFAFGIDPIGGGMPDDVPSDWPHLDEILKYNSGVRLKLDQILDSDLGSSEHNWRFPKETIMNVAIEHRLMHAETLAYMLHQMSLENKMHPLGYRCARTEQLGRQHANRMIEIPGGTATLGTPRNGKAFGWDNEFEEFSVQVPAFAISAFKITNGEFLRFVSEGGYDDHRFWSDANWDWIKKKQIMHPCFWVKRQNQWFFRAMFEELPLPLDWPVYVSHAEAEAYAHYVGGFLPTEAQYHRSVYGTPQGDERQYPWGEAPPSATHGNFDFHLWDPVAVGSYPNGKSAFGLEDALGNGLEWTSSTFKPLPGFEAFPFYPGYSANFFDQDHFVVKGASSRTASCMLRRSFRNWFQPHYQYPYASFRCVEI